MQSVVESQILDDLASKHLERATHILESGPQQCVADAICDALGELSDPWILSMGSDAEHRIVAGDRLDQPRDICGIVLAIAVHRDDQVSSCGSEARLECSALTAAWHQGQHP